MIVGGYSLDLYCDHPNHPKEFGVSYGIEVPQNYPFQFYSQTASNCQKQARKAGWKLNLTEKTCICPNCAKTKS